MLGREHPPSQPVHGGFKRETGPRRRLIEQRRQDLVLVVERTAARHHALHPTRAIEQLHQQRHGKLLRFDDVAEPLHMRIARSRIRSSRGPIRIRGRHSVHVDLTRAASKSRPSA